MKPIQEDAVGIVLNNSTPTQVNEGLCLRRKSRSFSNSRVSVLIPSSYSPHEEVALSKAGVCVPHV